MNPTYIPDAFEIARRNAYFDNLVGENPWNHTKRYIDEKRLAYFKGEDEAAILTIRKLQQELTQELTQERDFTNEAN